MALAKTNFAVSTLAGPITNASGQLTISSNTTRFPQTGSFFMVIWSASYNAPHLDPGVEIVLATLSAGSTYNITRGQDNTVASAHSAGDNVMHGNTAGTFAQIFEDAFPSVAVDPPFVLGQKQGWFNTTDGQLKFSDGINAAPRIVA